MYKHSSNGTIKEVVQSAGTIFDGLDFCAPAFTCGSQEGRWKGTWVLSGNFDDDDDRKDHLNLCISEKIPECVDKAAEEGN